MDQNFLFWLVYFFPLYRCPAVKLCPKPRQFAGLPSTRYMYIQWELHLLTCNIKHAYVHTSFSYHIGAQQSSLASNQGISESFTPQGTYILQSNYNHVLPNVPSFSQWFRKQEGGCSLPDFVKCQFSFLSKPYTLSYKDDILYTVVL